MELDRGLCNVVNALRTCSNALSAVLVIDWLLHDEAGIEACRRLRQLERLTHLPIVLLADSNSTVDKHRASAAGARSITVTPILARDLRVRLSELMDCAAISLKGAEVVRVGDIEVDVAANLARRLGRILQLGPSEFRLLELLVRSPSHLATRERIVENLWGADISVKTATVNIHVRGIGYQLLRR